MQKLIIPENYKSLITVRETESVIKKIKDFFQKELAKELNLDRVSAPLFVRPETGLNDDLNGVERPVSFEVLCIDNKRVEVVHSLAKWKRLALKRYGYDIGTGIYTDMNAIRRDEETGNLHSIYVDQWDWEKIINQSDRTMDTLKDTVKRIYAALKRTEFYVASLYEQIKPILPDDIYFITTKELKEKYPDLTAKEREDAIAKEHGAVFIMQIGDYIDGEKHDGRAPDYDDWKLNGDMILYYPVLDRAVEITSMGIRVDKEALLYQLKVTEAEDRASLPFHKMLLDGELPFTIGGGIGQSRLCMFMLKKAHVGEVQASIWPDSMIKECEENNIFLL